jgi:hypothetical protein
MDFPTLRGDMEGALRGIAAHDGTVQLEQLLGELRVLTDHLVAIREELDRLP